jgi:transposase
MLADDVIPGLPYLKVEEVRRGRGFEVICRLEKRACCPRCEGEQLRLKDKKLRSIKGITHGNVRTDLLVLVSKYRCQLCGRTFWKRSPACGSTAGPASP